MSITKALPVPSPTPRARAASDAMRRRALERLYQRKAAVDELIDSLENYQSCQERHQTARAALTAVPKCS